MNLDRQYRETLAEFFRPEYRIRYARVPHNTYVDVGGQLCLVLSTEQGTGSHKRPPVLHYLLHEMAHFIEVDSWRCCLIDWGLTVPTLVIEGVTSWLEPSTCQPLQREARTTAIAQHLHCIFGAPIDSDNSHVRYVPGWDYVPGESDEQKLVTFDQWVATEASQWSEDSVRAAWHGKMPVLANNLGKMPVLANNLDRETEETLG